MTAPTRAWLAEQYHTGRFDLPNAHSHNISDDEKEVFANAFSSLAVGAKDKKHLEKAALVARFQSQFPGVIAPTFADCVYRILAYHSTAPFYHAPGLIPQSLSMLDLERGLAWLLPDRHLRMSEVGNMGRIRTAADGRRLLFQSLATRSVETPEGPSIETARRRYAHRNAFHLEHVAKHYGWGRETDGLVEYARTNRDDDGDEMYHDLLDVLQYNVPENYPYRSARDDLRPLAKELKVDFDFHKLAIPRVELAGLVRGLLALQFESAPSILESIGLHKLDESVESVMAKFVCNDIELQAAYPDAQDLVAWPAFDYGLQRLEHLFDPIHRLLIDTLIGGKTAGIDGHDLGDLYNVILPPELQSGKEIKSRTQVLPLGSMALLHAILPPIIDWECCHTVLSWCLESSGSETETELRDKDVIWAKIRREALDMDGEPSAAMILAFKGIDTSSGERCTAGVAAASDFYRNEGRELVYSLHPFQLAPSIRYTKLLDQRWQKDSDGALLFGDTPSSQLSLRVDKKTDELEMSTFGQSRTIRLDSLEVWTDSGIAERFMGNLQN